jgi:hypothetical protein
MSRSLDADALLEATTEELALYLRNGAVNTQALARSLEYDGLDIEDWERVKRMHFCLAQLVRDFIDVLPERVRRIKTEHQREHIETRGEVRGRINWGSTLRTWSETGYADQSRYTCDTPYTEYDIPENRVLKRLLWQVYRTVTSELADVDYGWRREYWSDERIQQFDRLYSQNVHLNRIPDGQSVAVTGQDLTTARRARLPLYTEAYELYEQFQRLQADSFDPDIVALLAETLIVPASEPRLFELFSVFQLLKRLAPPRQGFQLRPIEPGSEALAQLRSSDRRLDVYHDSTGGLAFHEPLDRSQKPTHPTFRRYQEALVEYSETLAGLTGDEHEPALYRGRPDLVVEVYETDDGDEQLVGVVIGEFKYSSQEQTFRQGLEELVTYRRFAKQERYLIDDVEIPVLGILVTNGGADSGTAQDCVHLTGHDLLGAVDDGSVPIEIGGQG